MNERLIEMRDYVSDHVMTATEASLGFISDNALEIGGVLVAVGVLFAIDLCWRRWLKGRGYRMALKDRDRKMDEILTRVINDGLFEAECAGHVSRQEVRRKYAELQSKLDLPDLVPKQHLLANTKERIKSKRIKEGKLDPNTIGKKKFSERIGSFATKFWRPKAV